MEFNVGLIVKKCNCGWCFLARYEYEKYCPQCRDEKDLKRCICCNKVVEHGQRKYCIECSQIIKKVSAKASKSRMSLKDNLQRDVICNYDCFNCPYSDCILPADEDTETGRLF